MSMPLWSLLYSTIVLYDTKKLKRLNEVGIQVIKSSETRDKDGITSLLWHLEK